MIQRSTKRQAGPPAHYYLETDRRYLDEQNTLVEWCTFGTRNNHRSNTILLVGETGTGKTTLINTIFNHSLGVEFKDQLWFEITEEGDDDPTESQTKKVTVYEVFVQNRPTLTIIDTPGYGDTRGRKNDRLIAENLLQLFRSENGIHEITAVALVVKSSQNKITDRQAYIFDSVLSLFARDVAENIMLLVTHAGNGIISKNLRQALAKEKIPCGKNKDGQPLHFLFDNCQSDDFPDSEAYESSQVQWDIGVRNVQKLMESLDNMRVKSMRMCEGVLKDRKQLEASVNSVREKITLIDYNQNMLHQTEEALELNRQNMEKVKNFTYEVDEPFKERVPTPDSKEATCCTVCEENCHYPGCWWVRDLSWCSAMTSNYCTVCTKRCHYKKHVKEAKMYKLSTRKVTKTYEDLKAMYMSAGENIRNNQDIQQQITASLKKEEADKSRLLDQAYQCIMQLENIALKSKSLSTLENLDFLIEKMRETGSVERVQKLEVIKKRCEEENKKEASAYRLGLFN